MLVVVYFFSFVAYWNLIIVICNIVGNKECGILAMNLDLVFIYFLTNLLPALKPICWISILEELIQL